MNRVAVAKTHTTLASTSAGSNADSGFEQLIDQFGNRHRDSRLDSWVTDVEAPDLLRLYEDMVVVRRIDQEATALQRQGELGLWPPLLGQEAAQVGSAHALRSDDFIFSSYRENAVAYCRGIPVADLTKVWRGVSASGWNPYDYRMATPQVIIGAQALHATGYAMGIQLKGTDDVAIAYFGDGATSEGDVSEAMVFAATYRAPVVFFCQNNQLAISEPVTLQSGTPIAQRATGFGIPSIRVDGNDVLAVLAATREALDRARTGGGPTFIEAVTYRMGPHTTADDPTRYRTAEELEVWAARDPLSRLAAYLRSTGALDDDAQGAIDSHAATVAAELRAGCVALPQPAALSVFDNIYAEPNSKLTRQRAQYERYLALFEGSAS